MTDNINMLPIVSDADIKALTKARKNYGDSWKKRGGVGAFMMAARKWDRLENRLMSPPRDQSLVPDFQQYDIFGAIKTDRRAEGIIDDIRDLRRYLMLIEAEMIAQGFGVAEVKKDAPEVVQTSDGKTFLLHDAPIDLGVTKEAWANAPIDLGVASDAEFSTGPIPPSMRHG